MRKRNSRNRHPSHHHVQGGVILTISEQRRIAGLLVVNDIMNGRDWFTDIGETRQRIVTTAKKINIEPNLVLSVLQVMTKPLLENLFRPISDKEMHEWCLHHEEDPQQRGG